MLFRLIGCFILLQTSVLLGSASAPHLKWMTNYEKAQVEGSKEKKPLLLFFTGSDWSGWGMKMKQELLDTPAFIETVEDAFVFVMVDFPHYKTLPAEELKQNTRLKDSFEINETPRLIILNENNHEIARFGYCEEPGRKFAIDLLRILKNDQELSAVLSTLKAESHTFSSLELEKFYKLAVELNREEDAEYLLGSGLKSPDPLFFLLEKYRLLVEQGKREEFMTKAIREDLLSRDPLNEKKMHYSTALIDFQDLAGRDSAHKDPKNVIHPLENYLEQFGSKDPENVWRIEMMIAQFYLDYDQSKTALHHAEAAFKSAPSDRKGEIEHSLQCIRKQVQSEEIAKKE